MPRSITLPKAIKATSILEQEYQKTDETNIHKEKLVKLVGAFLTKYIHKDVQGSSLTKTLVISLSGGVDSMVLCKILVLLAKEHNDKQYRNSDARREGTSNINVPRNKRQKLNTTAPKINVLALHVNYNNRPESAAEAQGVVALFDAMKKGIKTGFFELPNTLPTRRAP